MSDERKYQSMMEGHVDRQLKREWEQQYEPKAAAYFARPALVCQLCGTPMEVNPEDGRNYEMDNWERKWSLHRKCANEVSNQLDRQTGILSERR